MAIPISYNIRNMRQRKSATIMTALGIALTVTTAIFIMSLLAGLDEAFRTSGDPQNVLCLRKGSAAALSSGIPHEAEAVLKTLPGVARDARGEQMASGELVVIVVLPPCSSRVTVPIASPGYHASSNRSVATKRSSGTISR